MRRSPSPGTVGSAAKRRRAQEWLRAAFAEHQAGRLSDAEALYERVLARDPGQAQALHYLGMLCHQTGRPERAVDLLKKSVRAEPDPIVLNNLGGMLMEQERFAEATRFYGLAVQRRPDYITAHFNLGTLLHDTGDNARAAYHYRRVVESKPNDVEAWNSLGLMLMEPETLVEAIECFRRAIALAPDYAQAHNNLGCALMDQGEIENARPCFVKAIDLDPRFARAYENLVRSRRFTVDDQDIIQRLHAGVEMPGTADESLVIFHFALGKIYDDCADYDTAFHHYRLGNELVKKSTPFDWQGSERTIANTIATFSADFLASRNGFGHESDRPIFIVGMPRSGSTLVEQIISAHPHVRGAGELTYLADMTATIPGLLNTDTPYPECAELLDRAQVHALAEQYLVHFESPSADIRRVTDKLPGNFLHLGLIALMFPDSRIVHCRRDPMDVGLSIYFQRFATRHDYAYDLVDIGTYYRQYQLLMEHWRNMPLPRMMEVDYEQLVAELESCSRRLIDFCGLAWDDRCLNYHQSQRTVRTASNWQVRQPLYSRSVRRWRHYESHLTALSETLAGTRSPL